MPTVPRRLRRNYDVVHKTDTKPAQLACPGRGPRTGPSPRGTWGMLAPPLWGARHGDDWGERMAFATAELTSLRPGASRELNRQVAVGMAVVMFIVNLVGFGPTFFLRPFFDVPQIPLYLYLHGVVGTAWFALLVVQAVLIANRQFTRHRQLGWFGVGLAAVIMGLGAYTSTHMVPRNAAAHPPLSDADIQLYSAVTAADLAGFVVFPTLVALAIYFRKRADIHMRLMLIATMEILGPAFARIGSWGGVYPTAIATVTFGLLGVLIIHDLWTRRRIHLATVLGFAFLIGVNAAFQASGVGPAIVAYRLAHL